MQRTALVTVWLGPLPSYLWMFLSSLARNPDIAFKFIADSPPPPSIPANVEWIRQSARQLEKRIHDRVNCPVDLNNSYKLTDFKPAFGVILADVLEGYEFWGHIDCDIVLGDISVFLTDERLSAFDILIARGRGFVYGPLTVYRNSEEINWLFKSAPDWFNTFTCSGACAFDENCHRKRIADDMLPPLVRFKGGERVSMSDIVFDAARTGKIRLYDGDHVHEGSGRESPLRLRWEQGHLYDESPFRQRYENLALHKEPQTSPREVIFYHLLFTKRDPLFFIPPPKTLPNLFYISRFGISERSPVTLVHRLRSLARLTGAVLTIQFRRVQKKLLKLQSKLISTSERGDR